MGDEFGEPTKDGIRLHTLLAHEDIAQMVGTSRESVTRSLSKLKRKRLIRALNGELVIRNRAALMALR
jgi:CRP/FNR family transcriptional regulator